jgi:hypothetical protein
LLTGPGLAQERAGVAASSDVDVGHIRRGHAEMRLEQVKAHLDETWFDSLDPCDEVSPVYYGEQA